MPGEPNFRAVPDGGLDVGVLGRIEYDLYAVDHNRPLAEVEHFSRHLGGSSTNIGESLARLGPRDGIIRALCAQGRGL